jgi:hypothetical protein
MAQFILFMMFFTSPPAKPGKQVWTYSNSIKMEFQSMDACITFGTVVQNRLGTTATTTMRGWCVDNKFGTSTFDEANPSKGIEEPRKNDAHFYAFTPKPGR